MYAVWYRRNRSKWRLFGGYKTQKEAEQAVQNAWTITPRRRTRPILQGAETLIVEGSRNPNLDRE